MAETLLRIITEEDNAKDDSVTPNSRQDVGNVSMQSSPRAKREQVQAACQSCRRKKTKCDGARPCANCAARHVVCEYQVREGETQARALKRKYDDIQQSNQVYAELFHMLRHSSDREVEEIVRQIRGGHSADVVLNYMSSSDTAILEPDLRQLALECFLVSLAHSTGSLRDIIRLASSTLDRTSHVDLPAPHVFSTLRNQIVHLTQVETLVKMPKRLDVASLITSNESAIGSTSEVIQPHASALDSTRSSDPSEHDQSNDFHPLHNVPAAPWTTITESDEAVSHLISVFLAWINPTWRFVEADLFLLGMRSKRLDSDFCSPFLVNSICAIASLQSEHDVAFSNEKRDRITRGQNFHEEALRLWAQEECRSSVTNMQALCILSLESNYRAKDRLGLTLIPIAVELNSHVPLQLNEGRCAAQGFSRRDFRRARLAIHWTVVSTHVIMRIAFMSGATTRMEDRNLPKIRDVFDDKMEYWTGYPLSGASVAYRPTLYLLERSRLTKLFQEMHDMLFDSWARHHLSTKDITTAADRLSFKMQEWYRYLPVELHYEWPMSVAVWELHASYYAFSMTLSLSTRARIQQIQGLSESTAPPMEESREDELFRSRKAREMLSHAIGLAHRAAQILRDFRQRYGFKVTPAWLLQLQAVTSSVLLLDPELAGPASPTTFNIEEPIQDSRQAFDEVFRGLLGTAVEVMIARGIARMTYHTAQAQKVTLSQSVQSVLKVMSATTWHPRDIAQVNSMFPNFATIKGHEDRERMTELLTRWEKMDI